jgi:heme oxygenase
MQTFESGKDIMAALKAGTVEQHRQVESLMPFFTPGFSLPEYLRILEAFLGFFEPVEQLLTETLAPTPVGAALSQRRRAHLLQQDLRALGVADSAIAVLPRCAALPCLDTSLRALGCMYVLEGSTLGGQIIGRELAWRFALEESSGAAFFRGYGSRAGEMWRSFCTTLRDQEFDPQQQAEVVHGAVDTFSALESWLRKASPIA